MKIIICDEKGKDKNNIVDLLKNYKQDNDCNIHIIDCESEVKLYEVTKDKKEVVEFPFVEGKTKLHIDDIIYIETFKHKNIFHTTTKDYSIYRKLSDIEKDFVNQDFLRAHISYLVNMKYIKKISSYVLTLSNGKELSVPKSRYQDVKRKFQQFIDMNK
ncbi:MAG: LytTR family transcriptional regulator DNA-binding domain-containing protein [Lachnospiraceae bacterium]|nr:LytTR family transcriptional regulator DNA-binding domain-containing protein [Lachnospiraceae bacterium]